MNLQLSGKRALITGSTAGIGKGIASLLAAEGCEVVIHGRNRARADAVSSEIGGKVSIAIGDLSTESGADAIKEAAGEIDILVNNVGSIVTPGKKWNELSDTDWIDSYQQNVVASARMINRFVEGMKVRGWGRVINFASTGANQPSDLQPNFYAAKAGILNMTVSLAKSLGSSGVTVNTVSPGPIFTDLSAEVVDKIRIEQGWGDISVEEAGRRTIESLNIPLNRWGTIDEVAYAVCMIASPLSSYITGANIRVDGGDVRSIN
jgi:3-oxoacyl-[acyl-carrier protein] reductase